MNSNILNVNITTQESSQANIKSLAELTEIVEGGIKVLTDGEDITRNENSVLKFSDKAYVPSDYSGLGRKYLRKNMINVEFEELLPFNGFVEDVDVESFTPEMIPDLIYYDVVNKYFVATQLISPVLKYYNSWNDITAAVPKAGKYMTPLATTGFVYENKIYKATENGLVESLSTLKNVLDQSMISNANTIYHIQYDYDLLGNTIVIPRHCVLIFDGGTFRNGTVNGNHTRVYSVSPNSPFVNVSVDSITMLSNAAFSGSYNDLTDKPVIPDTSSFITDEEASSKFAVIDGVYTKDQTYDKDEIDEAVGNITDNLNNNYYDKRAIDTTLENSLAEKANVGDSYTKDESDVKYATSGVIADLNESVATLNQSVSNIGANVSSIDSSIRNDYYTKTAIDDNYYTKILTDDKFATQDSIDSKVDISALDSYYIKSDIDTKVQAINDKIVASSLTNKSVMISNVENIRNTNNSWRTTVYADDSKWVWENTNTPSETDCYIFVDKNTSFGLSGIQINLFINGLQANSENGYSNVLVQCFKFKNGQIVSSFGVTNTFFVDLATNASSFFTNTYIPWVQVTDFDSIGVMVSNLSDSALKASDDVKLTIKTKGTGLVSGYAYSLSYDDIRNYEATNNLTLSTSDGASFQVFVKNNNTGNISTPIGSDLKNSTYQLTENDYSALKNALMTDSTSLIIVPSLIGGNVNTSASLNIFNS